MLVAGPQLMSSSPPAPCHSFGSLQCRPAVSQETDHTSPALVGSSGSKTSPSIGFPFWQDLAAPGVSSQGGGEEGVFLEHGGLWPL